MKELTASLKEFVESQELLRLAYIDSEGYPRVVPLWFVVIDDNYYCGTGTTSAKWKVLQHDPRVGWVIDGGPRDGYKGASMCGRAEEVTEAQTRQAIYSALGKKYFGSEQHPKFVEIYGQLDDADTVYFRLKVEEGISWEY